MTVADTSIAAYREHRDSGKLSAQASHILGCMQLGRAYSRRELVAETGIELSSVCARIHELLAVDLVREMPPRKCSITGRTVKPVFKVILF